MSVRLAAAALQALGRALDQEAHVLARHPGLLWQQLHNRLQFDVFDLGSRSAAERSRRSKALRPWIHRYSRTAESEFLVRTVPAHTGEVTDCAISADGLWILSAGVDGYLRVWDAGSGAEATAIHHVDDPGEITCVDISPEGDWLLVGRYDGTVRVLDTATGSEMLQIPCTAEHPDFGWRAAVIACRIIHRGTVLLAEGADRKVQLFDRSGEPLDPAETVILDGATAWEWAYELEAILGWPVAVESGEGTRSLVLPDPRFKVLSDHNARLTASAVAPDGTWVASGGDDAQVRIWDARTGLERVSFVGHAGEITSLAVSPDGSWLVSGGSDGQLRVWRTEAGAERAVSRLHSAAVRSVAISPDGSWSVSAAADGAIRTRSMRDGVPGMSPNPLTSVLTCSAISHDGALVAAGGWDNRLRIYDASDGSKAVVIEAHDGAVFGCAFTPIGDVASCGGDGWLRIWDISSASQPFALIEFTDNASCWLMACAVSPDGGSIAACGEDGTVWLWDADDVRVRHRLTGHEGPATACGFDPSGRRLVTGGDDRTVRVWDVLTGDALAVFETPAAVCDITIEPDGNRVAVAGGDGAATIWDLTTRIEIAAYIGHVGAVNAVAWTPDGLGLISAGDDASTRVWDIGAGRTRADPPLLAGAVSACAIDPYGQWVVVAGDGDAGVWRLADATSLCQFPSGPASGCAVSPDGALVALSGTRDGTRDPFERISLWRIADDPSFVDSRALDVGQANGVVASPDGSWFVTPCDDTVVCWPRTEDIEAPSGWEEWRGDDQLSAAVTPDGTRIVTTFEQGDIVVWELDGGVVHQLSGHDGPVRCCAADPGGRWVTAGGDDGTIRRWDLVTGEPLAVVSAHSGGVTGCGVSPDGEWLVSCGADAMVRWWPVAGGRPVEVASDGPLTAVAVHPHIPLCVYGDGSGGVHMAHVIGVEYRPLIVTAADLGDGPAIRCPACSDPFPFEERQRGQGLDCPSCGKSLLINPFTVGEDDWWRNASQ